MIVCVCTVISASAVRERIGCGARTLIAQMGVENYLALQVGEEEAAK